MMPPDPPDAADVEYGAVEYGAAQDAEPEAAAWEDAAERRWRRRRRRRRLIVLAFFLIVLLALGGAAGYGMWAIRGAATGERVRVSIPQGANASEITQILGDAGVIRVPWLFRVYLRWRGEGAALRPGTYEMTADSGYASVLTALRKGPPVETWRFTIPEGKTLSETVAIIAARTRIPRADLLRETHTSVNTHPLIPRGVDTLEGFLFPKTYQIEKDASAKDVVQRLLRQFDRETASFDFSRAERFRVTPYEIVTIASMIEREAKVAKDRRLISAVIHNRLRRGMRLEIDATVQYALFQRTGKYKHPLTFADLRVSSPYNTYLIDRLPPGPIASPGRAAIEAALKPANVDYLYYVVINEKTGEHGFARTFAEFQRLRRRAQSSR